MSWQVTATTIQCDYVGDFAVLMVYGDGGVRCSYYGRYSEAKGKDSVKKLQNCKGPDCPLLTEFKEKAFAM